MKAMGISTGSASKVWQDFIESGGQGSNNGWHTRGEVTRKKVTAHGETLDKVVVVETRCCRQRGGVVPEDLRVLQPIEAFGDFGEDGRLNSFLLCDTDTPLQKKVKRARLTRIEVVAVVLYTGTLSGLCLTSVWLYSVPCPAPKPLSSQFEPLSRLCHVSSLSYTECQQVLVSCSTMACCEDSGIAARCQPLWSLDLQSSGICWAKKTLQTA
jgi:hypothetical protein